MSKKQKKQENYREMRNEFIDAIKNFAGKEAPEEFAPVADWMESLPDHWSEAETTHTLTNPYVWMDTTPPNRRQQFCGPCCNRCQHRFGSTSNSRWCEGHYQQERCYRFKLEKR